MANERIILGLNNRIADATITSSGATWSSALPLSNVQDKRLAKVASTSTTTTFTITINLISKNTSCPRPIGCVGILNHTLTPADTVQIRTYKGALVTLKDDSGVLNPWPFLASDDPVFDTYTYSAAIIDSDRRAYASPHLIYFLPTNYDADYVTITITTGLAQSIGRLFVGQQFWPDINIEYGSAEWGLLDFSDIVMTKNRVKYAYNYKLLRTLDVAFKWLNNGESIGGITNAMRKAGLTGEVMVAPGLPTYTTISGGKTVDSNWFERAFIGNFSSLDKITNPYLSTDSASLHIEEVAI